MKVATSLSEGDEAGLRILGQPLEDLMRNHGFAECVHLMLFGFLPDKGRARLLEAILVSAIDHGLNAPSIHVARAVASCGVALPQAVGAGISAIGTNHGGAGLACARLLQEALAREEGDPADLDGIAQRVIEDSTREGKNLPGFGHRVYKTLDPRARVLLDLATELGYRGGHVSLALAVAEGLARAKGRPLPLNVDGAQAAILSDMGLGWPKVQATFIIGRSLGLCAHVAEELATGKPLGYLKAAMVEEDYRGPQA